VRILLGGVLRIRSDHPSRCQQSLAGDLTTAPLEIGVGSSPSPKGTGGTPVDVQSDPRGSCRSDSREREGQRTHSRDRGAPTPRTHTGRQH